MKKLCLKIMNWTEQFKSDKLLIPKKICLYYSILLLKKPKYFMSYKITCTPNKDTFWVGNKKLSANNFWKRLDHIYTKCWLKDEFSMTLMKLWLDFLFWRSTSTFRNIFSGHLHSSFLFVCMVKRWQY